LTGRSQADTSGEKVSNWLPITRSIVRGSGFGPTLYSIYAGDLKTLFDNKLYLLCKYEDDINLFLEKSADVISVEGGILNLME
jgi:hypothetical protein